MFALVDANSFYASCERVFQPELAGRPVVVLSNNDGCIIARSKEAKAIGIEMGQPFFQCRDQLSRNNVAVFSSNYTLYDDMSRRVQDTLRRLSGDMEVYSIDESFLWWRDLPTDWMRLGIEARDIVKQWTGLPVGVGIGPTKTLAKLANHLSKRADGATGVHVLENQDSITRALESVDLINLWGVSTGFCKRLAKLQITRPLQLRDADPKIIRDHLGVVGERIVYELRGISCIALQAVAPHRKNICCSRSFGKVTNDIEAMREAVVTFVSQAAVKLRRQDLAAQRIAVFVQTDRHADVEQYASTWGMQLVTATFCTTTLANAAVGCLHRVFKPQHHYKKAGVLLLDLCSQSEIQPDLFAKPDTHRQRRLMSTVDGINQAFGRGSIRLASASPFTLNACRTWHLRSEYRSKRYTTHWDELPVARAEKA